MTDNFHLPFRQIHLDFHTGPLVPGVGVDFDARAFAREMKQAHVNSVTVFAKCHHGHLYYRTNHPARHPTLPRGLDLLGKQIAALHAAGIRAPIYISIQCDEYAANTHPEWVARREDSGQVKWGERVFKPGWQILDMSSPYREYVTEQIREILAKFKPVDGVFFDMCWDQSSTSKWAIAGMVKAGLDPECEADRKRYSGQVSMDYMRSFHRMVRASSPRATVFFNGRDMGRIRPELAVQEQIEIEALPTGGWGYGFFSRIASYARTFGKPYMGMTARFHKNWADFGGLKPYPALEYETSLMMAHGARCSIGDQMHPRGVLDKAAYELIGNAYARVSDREPWLDGARTLAEIGVIRAAGAQPDAKFGGSADEGARRMLTHLKCQFDIVDFESDLDRYKVLVLPDVVPLDADRLKLLRGYLRKGGKLLASGQSGLSQDGSKWLLPELDLRAAGPSPFTTTYFRVRRLFAAGIPQTDHVIYDRGWRVLPGRRGGQGFTVVANIVEPYFERGWDHFCSHYQTPGDNKVSRWAAAVVSGRAGYVSFPVFGAYARHGNYPYRLLVGKLLAELLPDPLLTVEAPVTAEATVARQGRRHIVHLLHYTPQRLAEGLDIVTDITPLHDVRVSLRLPKAPRRVYLAPEQADLLFVWSAKAGRANVTVPRVAGHAMVVFD